MTLQSFFNLDERFVWDASIPIKFEQDGKESTKCNKQSSLTS